ncbi:MAG: OB-fold domain-containing protein [Candidatus Lokiarchaeota archaeon]|nr:OB-fold domain-containing protein [Candidatus Lokiarchaeota archaeon]
MSTEKPILQSNYLDFLKERRLMGSKCKTCGQVDLPPRPICSKCLSPDVGWIDLTGQNGTLTTFSCVHVGTRKFEERGYSAKNPYAFGVVTLDNGPAITALLQGVDPKKPETIKIGMKLKLKFVETQTPAGPQVDVGFEPV